MRLKNMMRSFTLLVILFGAFESYGELPEEGVHRYKKYGSRVYSYLSPEQIRKTMLFGESCEDVSSSAAKFLRWSKKVSQYSLDLKSTFPVCECKPRAPEDNVRNVCGLDVSDFFPKFTPENFISCHGPNCHNTALRIAGFLGHDQLRCSEPYELDYFTLRYCSEVCHMNEAKTNDLLVLRHPHNGSWHTLVYIADNLAFARTGHHRSDVYELVDPRLLYHLRAADTSIKVFRRNATLDTESAAGEEIRKLEGKVSELVASRLSQDELKLRLRELYQEFDRLSEKSDRGRNLPDKEHYALSSLENIFSYNGIAADPAYRGGLGQQLAVDTATQCINCLEGYRLGLIALML